MLNAKWCFTWHFLFLLFLKCSALVAAVLFVTDLFDLQVMSATPGLHLQGIGLFTDKVAGT